MPPSHRCGPNCTKDWGPTRKAHCARCGRNFSTPANFDKHRDANKGECKPPYKAGLEFNWKRNCWQQPGEVDINERLGRSASA